MADITNPQVVKHCNEVARPLADLLYQLRKRCEEYALLVVRDFEDHTGGNANGDVILDGAASDGRHPITKGDVLGIKFVAEQVLAALTADDREALVLELAVNLRS